MIWCGGVDNSDVPDPLRHGDIQRRTSMLREGRRHAFDEVSAPISNVVGFRGVSENDDCVWIASGHGDSARASALLLTSQANI
jgi:hypothetical protein